MQNLRETPRHRPWRLPLAALAALAVTACALASSGAAPPAPAGCRDAARVAWSVPAESVAVVSWNTHVGGGDLAALVRDLRAGAGGSPPARLPHPGRG